MNLGHELSDDEVLGTARDSLSERPVASPPDVKSIMARGRAQQKRRRSIVAGGAVTGIAASSALALALAGVLGPARPPETVRTVAYTLTSHSNGTATLTLNPGELFDPAQLQDDLAASGIPALVTTNSYCTSDPEPAGLSQVVSLPGPGSWQGKSSETPSITIDPSAMPAGTELSIANFQLTNRGLQADIDLIDIGSYVCTGAPPTLGPGTPGFGAIYSGQRDGGHSIQLAPGSD